MCHNQWKSWIKHCVISPAVMSLLVQNNAQKLWSIVCRDFNINYLSVRLGFMI